MTRGNALTRETENDAIWYPDWRSGRPCLAGTGMSVNRVVVLTESGMTPNDIAAECDIDPALVIGALNYYREHKDAISADIAATQAASVALAESADVVISDSI